MTAFIAFEPQALLAEATQKAGLTDFGPPSFREGLDVFCRALETDASLILQMDADLSHDPKYLPALKKALDFVLDSQYPIGGWPQRFPLKSDFSHHGKPDYTSFITFNDDVAGENIQFLLYAYQSLGSDARVYDAMIRAMNVYLVTQQAKPQAGWGLQYTLDLKPVGARSYEPTALVTHTTAANVRQLLRFYRLTGDKKFLARVPEALDWLDSVKLPADQVKGKVQNAVGGVKDSLRGK